MDKRKYALVSTCYCVDCEKPTVEYAKHKFNFDGDVEDLHINFSNAFGPGHGLDDINIGISRRKDLVYGKIFMLKEYFEQNLLGKYEYICHIDFSDTKFARSFVQMMQEFELSGQDFLISTEKNCWPYFDAVKTWTTNQLEDVPFEYINTGAIVGKTEVFYDYIIKMHDICLSTDIDFWDDQGVWQYYHVHIQRFNTDKTSKYFFSTGLLDETYYRINENGDIFTKFDTQPYLIHDNSSFSLNLREKIK